MASVSQEYQGHNQADGSGKVKVTVLASEWGSSKGGLSTINRKLAIQLAKFSEVEITFLMPQCSEGDKKEALSHNINIVEAKKFIGFEDLALLSFPPDGLQIEVVIGHGAKLGCQAQVIRDVCKCKWVQVVHTDPEELGMFKSYPDPISKGQEKHDIEVKLCEKADFVVTIGPKLAESFRRYLQSCKNRQTIFDFTPGIFEEFLSVDEDLEKDLEERKNCTILVFGRGDAEDFQLKGFDIAGKAVASLADTHLIFVGAPDGKYQEIAQTFMECNLSANCLKVRGYVKCRESLRKLFCEVDLVVMPSRTDGFGLTGLEAFSAGLPVLVSKNSGFGESLSKVPFGSSFVIDSEKPEVWAAAIKNIWDKERQSRREEVQYLRSSYERKYSWTKQSEALLVKIINLVRARLRLQIDCEAITGARAQTGTGSVVTPQQSQEVIQGAREVPSSSNEQHAVVTPSLAAESELYGGIPFTEIDTQTVMNFIALKTYQGLDPSTPAQRNEFLLYLERVRKVLIVSTKPGSLVITVEVSSLQSLEDLWEDYSSGHVNKMAQKFLVTKELLEEFGLLKVKLTTFIAEEEYRACQEYFSGHDGNGMDETDLRLPGSEGQVEPQNQISSAIDQAFGCKQVKGGSKLNVTLVKNDDGWKIMVTTQLLTELAKNPSVKMSGVVARGNPELEDWAKKLNIELVNPKKWIGYSDKDCLAFPPDSLDIDILIIHSYGRDLGKQAQIIKDTKKCKWVHVVHTISEELAKYMKEEAGSQSGHQESEHDVQLQLCEIADIIIAIGPKVAEAYRTYLRFRGIDVFDLTPVIVHDLIDIRPVIEHGDIFRLAVSATYFKKYFEVKGVDIAAQTIALLDDFSYRIIFIVLPGEDTKVLESLLVNEKYINPRQFTVRPVKKNTGDLIKLLFEVHLFILPSRTEGFGTTCLSALSSDVPVLVSGNTGLGMALRKLPSGDNFVVDSEQPEDWAKKVKEVRAKGATNCAFEARQLRKEYMEKFHWREQCDNLVKKMFEMFPEKQESKKKSVEHLDLEGTDTMEGFYLEGAIQEMKVSTVPVQDNENGTLAKFVPKTGVPENNAHTLGPEMIAAGFSGRRVQETLDTTLHGIDVVDGLRTHQEPSSRLLTYVKQIPFQIRAKICIMLNILDDLQFRDFRLLGEKMNFDIYIIRNLEQRRNPTDELLKLWCSTRSTQPTVGCLIELLKDSDLERWDVVDILEKWVEDGDKK